MSKQIEAMKQALESLEDGEAGHAAQIIREALVEQQESVATLYGSLPVYDKPAQQDLPDLIAGALGVSRGTAYDMMREALAERYADHNPLSGPAKVFDAMAAAIRAGDSYGSVLRQYGFLEAKPAQQEPVACSDEMCACRGGPCVSCADGKQSITDTEALLQEIARLQDRIKALTLDVEFLSQPAQQEPVTTTCRDSFLSGYEAAQADSKVCDLPPHGWHCTRNAGHEWPCAAVKTDDHELVAHAMKRLAEQPAPVQGWKTVPVEPTVAMIDATGAVEADMREMVVANWKGMLAAAPQAQPAQQEPTKAAELVDALIAKYSDKLFDSVGPHDAAKFEEDCNHIKQALAEQPAQQKYRLLEHGDRIESGDTVLDSDSVTWHPLSGWEIGMRWGGNLMPIRRAINADHNIKEQP